MPDRLVVAFVPGVSPSTWARVWNERMRHVTLELRAASEPGAVEALADGSADMALVRLPIETEGRHVIPLWEEPAVVVASRDSAVAAADELSLGELADLGETVLEGRDAAVMELVAANVGIAIMPQQVARALSRRDVVARPLTDGATTRIALVWPVDHPSPHVDEFIGIVRGRTANSSRGDGPSARGENTGAGGSTTASAGAGGSRSGKPRSGARGDASRRRPARGGRPERR